MRNRMLHGHFFLVAVLATVAGACSGSDSAAARDVTGPVGRAPASLEAVTPTAVTGTVGSTISSSPTVRVKDAAGNPLTGITVTFATETFSRSVTTGADGMASFAEWTLGTRAGSQTLVASVPGVTSVVFTAAAAPGLATKFTHYGGSSQVAVAGRAAGRLVVSVRDAFDNPVAGVAVLFTATAGGGSIDRALGTSDADGLVTSGEWKLGAVGPNAAVATSNGLSSVGFSAFALPPEPQRMVYVGQPRYDYSGVATADIIILTTAALPGARQGEFMFVADVSPDFTWGTYTISNGKISLTVVAGEWFGWAEKPLSGWHTEEELGLNVFLDGPDLHATYVYRRQR